MGPSLSAEPGLPPEDEIKRISNFMRGTIAQGVADLSTPGLTVMDTKLTKFHGIYQQDDRDLRDDRRRQGLEKAVIFMVRVRVPGGVCTPQQYLDMDTLSQTHANGTIKITTRQAYQFHGVVKRNLKSTIQNINKALLDTLAACGDVCRNIMCDPIQTLTHPEVFAFTKNLSEHLSPRSSSYHEIWLDKKMVAGHAVQDVEPLYGPTYLPRKFKVSVCVPPNNSVDVFAGDLGYIAILENGKLEGFNVTIGGGMGTTHNNKKTFPRLADVLGFCTIDQAISVAEKVMLVQRDFGDRINRKHARLKYTVEDHGLEWYREQVETRLGYKLQPPRPFSFDSNADNYGWVKGGNGKWFYTMFIQNGRVYDSPDFKIKTGLREIAKIHDGDFRLTPNQNMIISGCTDQKKEEISQILHKYSIDNTRYSALRLNSMACVALPTCELAFAESERYLPSLVTLLDQIIDEAGLRNDAITIRMSGCPNGCSRPFVAEIAFVGKSPGFYNLYLGAGFAGERLNKLFRENMDEDEILTELRPIIMRYAKERKQGEHFGDFVIRAGIVRACTAGREWWD